MNLSQFWTPAHAAASYNMRLPRPNGVVPGQTHHQRVKGKLQVSLALAPFLLSAADRNAASPRDLDLAPGFDLSIYAQGIDGARGLAVDENGFLTVHTADPRMTYSISPAAGDAPVMVMLVAQDLPSADARTEFYALPARLLMNPGSRSAADALQQQPGNTALAADGTLFVLDQAAGVIYRIDHPAP